MAKARRRRKRYTATQRTEILAAANKEGLTALQVQKKFGVTPVTYYSWRKKLGAVRRRGRLVARTTVGGGVDLGSQVRYEVANKVRQIIPDIVRSEVTNYLSSLFAGNHRGRRRGVRA
jgi:transposase-like protein